jgi:hypothetical protein
MCLVLCGVSFFILCLSLSAYLFHWRIENEPGAAPDSVFLLVHRILLVSGAAGTLGFSVPYYLRRAGSPLRPFLPMAIGLLAYSPLLAITILMMV